MQKASLGQFNVADYTYRQDDISRPEKSKVHLVHAAKSQHQQLTFIVSMYFPMVSHMHVHHWTHTWLLKMTSTFPNIYPSISQTSSLAFVMQMSKVVYCLLDYLLNCDTKGQIIGLFPLRQFPLCQFPLCQFPFGQFPTLSIPILSIPIWSMLTKWELTKWELTK